MNTIEKETQKIKEIQNNIDNCNTIKKCISKYFDVINLKYSKDKNVRRYFYYFIRVYTDFSLQKIGGLLDQDHATVGYHITEVANKIAVDKEQLKIFNDLILIISKEIEL